MNDATPAPWIDPDDAPPLTAEWFDGADVYDGAMLVRCANRQQEAGIEPTS